MGWTVSVSWNAQSGSTDVDVSSPPPEVLNPAESPTQDSTVERELVPLDEWRRRVLPAKQPAGKTEEQ